MNVSNRSQTLEQLANRRIVPVVRSHSTEWADQAIQHLIDLGFTTFEITMTIPGALELMHKYSAKKDLLIGAGTILQLHQVEPCIQAGAQFIISPCVVEGMPSLCQEAEVVSVMTGLTSNEVVHAWNLGCDAVKVFPAESVGGSRHIKALKSVFPDIPLIPTGGVNINNLHAYLEAGAHFVGVGSELVNPSLFQNDANQQSLGKQYLQAVKKINVGG